MSHWLTVYWAEVKGNVYAIGPCAVVAAFVVWVKHRALMEAHRAHAVKLTRILEHLDPDAETDGLLDRIADRVDEQTPGGIRAVIDRVDALRPKRK